jgi:hypothetical protein
MTETIRTRGNKGTHVGGCNRDKVRTIQGNYVMRIYDGTDDAYRILVKKRSEDWRGEGPRGTLEDDI